MLKTYLNFNSDISSIDDVKAFIRNAFYQQKLNFNPDTAAEDYRESKSNEPCFSAEDAKKFNEKLDKCFDVCSNAGLSIYDISVDILNDYKVHNVINNAISQITKVYQGFQNEPLDGDETERYANLFLLELNHCSGNLSDSEYEGALAHHNYEVVEAPEMESGTN